MGVNITVTLPEPLCKVLQCHADEQDISRSKVIRNILTKWHEQQTAPFDVDLNICIHLAKHKCLFFNEPCKFEGRNASSCVGYGEK